MTKVGSKGRRLEDILFPSQEQGGSSSTMTTITTTTKRGAKDALMRTSVKHARHKSPHKRGANRSGEAKRRLERVVQGSVVVASKPSSGRVMAVLPAASDPWLVPSVPLDSPFLAVARDIQRERVLLDLAHARIRDALIDEVGSWIGIISLPHQSYEPT
jgi:hypothetical protein